MSAEQGGTTGPEKATGLALVDARRNSGEVDEAFKRSMASLSRQLVAARSGEGASSISVGSRGRQVDFDQEGRVSRRPSLKLALAFAFGVVASSVGIYAYHTMRAPASAPSPPTAMAAAPTSMPSAMPAISPPAPPPPPQSAVSVDPAPAAQALPAAASPAPAAAPVPAPVVSAPSARPPAARTPDQTDLNAAEVLELQRRLEALGMNPGYLDGIPGPRTAAAVRRYEEARGQPPTGNLDRELLTRLRQERN